MSMSANIDVTHTIADLDAVGLSIEKHLPSLIARLSLKGEGFMKNRNIVPVRTGTLYRSIHAHPTLNPNSIATGVDYAFIANIRSSKPGYIEKTVNYIEKIVPKESDIIIREALKKV